ncbi:MAG: cation:proton antiporter [Hyphomonadaceae bacterium]|nr:cation:proton antiporter [Hyphomonadaceae bacterium]
MDRREVFVAAVLFVVVAAAMAAEAAGLSMALGAFLAGLLLAETEFRHEIEADIEPFKGLLLGLFFVTVGMQIDLGQLSAAPLQVLAGVVGLLAVKAAILIPLARGFGLSWPHAIEMGFLLAQAGEFAFVIISTASQGGAIPSATADYMLLVVAVSLFLTPVSAALGATLARRLTRNAASTIQPADADVSGHVIVAGWTLRRGRWAPTQQQEIAHIALDTDVRLVNTLRKRGWPLHYGDASRKDVLATLGATRQPSLSP